LDQAALLAKYTTVHIVSLALSESIGIYGLVLFFLGDGFGTLSTFLGISALAIYFHRPKKEELEVMVVATKTDEMPSLQP